MPDITRYTAEERRRLREQALRNSKQNKTTGRKTTPAPVVTSPVVANKKIYTSPVKQSAPGMPPAVRSTPDIYRREIDKKFVTDMMNGSIARRTKYAENAPTNSGEVTAARNQVAANLSTISRLQAQYADTDDQEMKDLLANAYGAQMDFSSELDSLSEYIGQFDTPQQQRLFETETNLDEDLKGIDFADIEGLIRGYKEDMRTEADPAQRALIAEQIKLVEDWRRNNVTTRTEALKADLSGRSKDLAKAETAYGNYNEAARHTSYDAVMSDNYTSGEMPPDDAIIARIDYEWDKREDELRAEGYDEATIAEFAAAYESAKEDPQLWWATRRTAEEGTTTQEQMEAATQGIQGMENPWHIRQDIDRLTLDIADSERADQWRKYEDEAQDSAKWQTYLSRARAGIYADSMSDEVLGHDKRKLFGIVPTKYDNVHIAPEAEASYQYIKDKYGEDVAAQYADYAEGAYVDPALADQAVDWAHDLRKSDGVRRAAGLLVSRAINVATGIPEAVDMVGTTLASWISGQPVAPGAAPWSPYTEALDAFSEEMDRGMVEDLNGMGTVNDVVRTLTGKDVNVPAIGDFGWGDAYQSIVSMADSILAMKTTGKVGFGANIAADSYNEAFDKGYSGEQSLAVGLASVLTEVLPEIFALEVGGSSIKNAYSLLKTRGGFTLATMLYAGGSMVVDSLTEAFQEGATTWMNQGVDTAIGGAKSDFANAVEDLSRSGVYMSEDEAYAQAKRDQRDDIIRDAFSGFVGAVVPGVTGAISSTAMDMSAYNRFQNRLKEAQASAPVVSKEATAKAPAGTSEAAKAKAEARLATMKTTEGEASLVDNAPVTVAGITKTGTDATVTVTDESGADRQVKLEEVTVGKGTQGEVYAYAADMATPELANTFRMVYRPDQDISQVANGMEYVYEMAEGGAPETFLRKSSLTSALNDDQFKHAYDLGKKRRVETVKAEDEKATARLKSVLGNQWKGGTLSMGDVVEASLTEKQREDVELVRVLAGISGYKVELFQSTANEAGRFTRENGSFNRATNTISLDVNAGRDYVGDSMAKTALLRTMSHEVTHAIKANSPAIYGRLQEAVLEVLSTQGIDIDERISAVMTRDSSVKSRADALEEIVADACETMLGDSDVAQRFKEAHPEAARSLGEKILEFLKNLRDAIKKAFVGEAGAKSVEAKALLKDMDAFQKIAEIWTEGALQTSEVVGREAIEISPEVQQRIENDQTIDGVDEIKNSLRNDEEYMDRAETVNARNGFVNKETLRKAKKARAQIRDFFRDPKNKDLLNLPEDVLGKTFLRDSSYGGTEENTTVCIRSMAAQELMDAVSKSLGRPLTVQDTLLVSQEIAGLTDRPECYYCYVATDRRAYREYLGDYLRQRDEVVKKYKAGADKTSLYEEFLGGRKDTKNMKDRFNMWIKAIDKGETLISGADLASLADLFNEIQELRGAPASKSDTSRYKQLLDATKYAQSASWAKKMQGYAAYDNHILKWPQKKVNNLNKGYGLRMYSFSDFSPAFILENMQMVTDASVRGLNVLAYTKEIDFAKIFAPSGMNINVSVFAYEQNGIIAEDGMMGTAWAEAQALRGKYPNVGIVMVATNDNIMKWAMQQNWVDVVIPYHLVRTGQAVADYFGYKNYTSVSGDKKTLEFKKGSPTSVSPVEHRNDIVAYVDALQRYGLSPRFAEQMQGYEQYLAGEISPQQFRDMNPYYMKLVNETRRSYADTEAVQPVFDTEAAMKSIEAMIKQGGYYKPIGGSKTAQNEIAEDIADKINRDNKPVTNERTVNYDDVQNSTRDPYEVSDREILANALESAAKDSTEKAWLQGYKNDLADMNAMQQVLDENRAVVRELMFKKGRTAEESDRLKKAQERVKTLADQLTRKDKALIKIEAAAPIRAILDREGKKVREKMRAKEREDIAAMRQTQENAAFRKRIARKVKRLDELLRNPTDQKHVPDNLKAATLDMLKVFTDDTSVFDREKLERVRREYAELTNRDSDTSAAGMYDEDTAERIAHLAETIGGERLSRLTYAQLNEVMKVVDHFSHLISNANAVFIEGRRERVDALAEEVAAETQEKGIYMENRANMSALRKLLEQGMVTPAYFFRRLGGAMGRLGNALLNGENRFGVNALKSRETMTGIMQKYHHKAWAGDKRDKLSFVTEEGDVISLTREQALSLYATDKRERSNRLQNASHLRTGGIIIQQGKLELRENRPSNANAAPISSADMEKINAWLTAEQKAYADAMVEYISKDMSELGNETSQALHGYSKFGEGYYFPYRTSSDFRKTNLGDSETALLKSMGFTKSVIRNANTPIIVGDFTETVSEHVVKMLMYNSFAEAQDAFMRVYDHKLTKSRSVKSMIKTAWGKNITDYIEQFMRDVYGGVTRDMTDEFGDKWLSKFKKNAVLANASVTIQQPSALMRAMAYIDPEYFVGAPKAGSFSEAMNYAGTAVIKDIGSFDTNTGRSVAKWMVAEDYQGISEKAKALFTDADYRSDILGAGPEKMDQIAWGIMWDATKREQAAKTGLDINSEALKEIAGRRFDEVMRLTQVYDSVMARSQVMRSKSVYAKMLTAFMAEPTVTYNMFVDAWFDKQSGGKAKAKRVTRTMAALTGSILLNNLLKSLVAAARDDDDENETYRERYVKNFASNLVSDVNPLNYIPYAKDIMSIFQGYDVERSDISIFRAMYAAMQTMKDDSKSMYERTKSFAVFVGLATGIPFKNVWRDFEAGLNTINTVKEARVLREGWLTHAMEYGAGEIFGKKDTKANSTAELLEAAISGDSRAIDGLREHMSAYNGMDESQIETSLTNALKGRFEDGGVTEKDALRIMVDYAGYTKRDAEAKIAKWKYDVDTDNEFSDMQDDFVEGKISESDAISAMVEYGGKTEREAKAAVEKWKYQVDTGDKFSDVENMFVRGEMTKAEAEAALTEYGGYRKSEAADKVQQWQYEIDTGRKYSEMKDDYLDGTIRTNKEAADFRVKYGGQDPDSAEATVMQWQYDKDTGRVYSEMRYDFADGIISRSQAEGYLQKYGLKEPDEAYWTVEGWKYESDGESEWSGKFTHLHDAMADNDTASIDKAITQVYENSAYEDEDAAASAVVSAITSEYKPLYIAASEAERERLETLLLYAYRRAYELADKPWYGDYRRLKTIRKWLETDD